MLKNDYVQICNCIRIKGVVSNFTIVLNNNFTLYNCKNFSYYSNKLFSTIYNNEILIFRILDDKAFLILKLSTDINFKKIKYDNLIFYINNEAMITLN